jgi:serine phosphatase RsbU (regulator of sigma subunit)
VYGSKRLRDVLMAQRGSPASELVRAVLDAVQTFGGHSDAHDDLTILAARLV